MILLSPEITVILTAFLVLFLDLVFLENRGRVGQFVALVGLLAAAALTSSLFGTEATALGGRFAIDGLGLWFKLIFLLAAFLTLSIGFEPLHERAEFVVVTLFTLSGMMFLVSSRDLVSLYVSLELATIPLFALSAWSRTPRSGEGALKYLLMGAMASAFFLYGFGLLYGLTGQTALSEISRTLSASPALWVALCMVMAGIGFKLTLFPFHFWAPDAYEGAPPTVAAFLSVASKATGLVIAFQLFFRVFGSVLPSLGGFFAIFAAATMTLGNIVAIRQNNLKRFMAYSSISQAGYLLLGFLGHSGADASAMVFYMLVYVLTNLAVFAVLILNIEQRNNEDIHGLQGLSQSNPVLAALMMLALFGLAGIPPLSGFVGKFFLFAVAAKAGYYWLVGVAAINSTVSLYYYLRIVRQMYIEPPVPSAQPLIVSRIFGLGLGVATLGSVFCGLVPFFYENIGTYANRWLILVSH